MDKDLLLRAIADTCRDLVRDAVNGISVCRDFDAASLIGFMQMHQLLGVRRLMLPLAAEFGIAVMAEAVFNQYLSQLEDIVPGVDYCLAAGPTACWV